MKILQINKFYHEVGKSGGTGRYLFSLLKLLKAKGHQIQIFAMKDKNTLSSIYSPYFVEEQDFSSPTLSLFNLKKAFKFIYSFEAKKKIEALIKQERPELVHLHNIYHHITPSILPVLKKYHLPVVQTLHDFHLISPNYNLYFKGNPHEQCAHPQYWKALFHKCIKDSRIASLAIVIRMYFEKITKIYLKNVDYFIAPSNFLKQKYIDNGFPLEKITVLKPFIDLKFYRPNFSPGKYVLYFGRLHPQKGIEVLINAASELSEVNFKIAGAGKEEKNLVGLIRDKKIKNVEMLGEKRGKALKNLIRNSAFVILPSISYENAPYAVLEAFALGKPVVASNLGGLPELIEDKKTGLLFKAGDVQDLKEKILKLYPYPCLIRTMGLEARLYVEKNFSEEKHYNELLKLYKKAMKQ